MYYHIISLSPADWRVRSGAPRRIKVALLHTLGQELKPCSLLVTVGLELQQKASASIEWDQGG